MKHLPEMPDAAPLGARKDAAVSPSKVAAAWIEAHSTAAMCLLMAFFFCATVTEAYRRPFWYDEMFTYSLAILPGWHEIKQAMPPDGNPPLYVLLARFFLVWIKPAELALRMPSLLAYTASLGLLFAFVRRRLGSICALLSSLLLATHPFAVYYASEARPYALVLFFVCLGLWSWQRAVDPEMPNRLFLIPLGLAVAGTVLSHHLGIVGLGLALTCGELVRLVNRKRLDAGVLVAVFAGLSVVAFTLPMMHATRVALLEDVSLNQPVSLHRLITSYTDDSLRWATIYLLLLVLAIAVYLRRDRDSVMRRLSGNWPPHELAAVFGAGATLVAIFILIRSSTGYYAGPRYGFAVFVSLSALCAAVARLYPRSVQVVLCITALINLPRPHKLLHPVTHEASCFNALPHDPIVVGRGLYYPTAWHYASPELRPRLFFPYGADKDATGKRWIESSALILARGMMHMNAEPFHEFLDSTPHFILVSDPASTPDEAEFRKYLESHNYKLENVAVPTCREDNLDVTSVSRQ